MNRIVFAVAFAIGLVSVGWVGAGFVGASALGLAMTALIASVYLLGAYEIRQFRGATASLASALADLAQPLTEIGGWLSRVPPSLQHAVRLRIEGERVGLPGPALTPYLVGLLVMLGMLGTFLGMVITFKGAVFALEGSADLQAIRAALAAPIKGLGLSFGASVAGVAASAMLGLMSALSRRERLDAARLLDSRIATTLAPFSLAHQRRQTYNALQGQARALPDVAEKLQAMMDALERRSQQLGEQLAGQQAQFHREASAAYTGLADAVGTSLKESLAASARAAGESLRPVVETAMAGIAQESARAHLRQMEGAQRQIDAAQRQLDGLSAQFGATSRTVSDGWACALAQHALTSESQAAGLARSLAAFTQTFDERSGALVAAVQDGAARAQSDQAESDRTRLATWSGALVSSAGALQAQWERVGAQMLAQQRAASQALEKTSAEIAERTGGHAARTLGEIDRLISQSQALVAARVVAEAQWVQQHGQRMDDLTGVWRAELGELRADEAARGQAAVERLGELQAALAGHLTTLGASLEAPMTRLLRTAAEVPQAAAGVLTELREELARLSERDNLALRERTALMDDLRCVVDAVTRASGEQRTAIESLVGSASAVLAQAGGEFSQSLGAQESRAVQVAAQVTASAVELASLAESFGHGVQLFSATHDRLIDSLERVDTSLQQSMARSDEQLAYYVGQAREVIDLSISAQQGVVEDLRRLRIEQVALAGTPA